MTAVEPSMSLVLSLPPRLVRWGLNWWPPLLGAGIHVRRVAPDFREVVVEMALRRYNRNAFGTHFGGSLYAMTDPFFVLMLSHNLGPDYVVWDRSACIDYIAAGRSRVRAVLKLTDEDLTSIRRMTANGSKHLHLFHVDVVDAEDLLVARVEKLVYVRRRHPMRPPSFAPEEGLSSEARSAKGQ
jgi:acyl-coenzyme A thioesterase PaaI-like protein